MPKKTTHTDYHFDLGNSNDGAIGMCASISATSPKKALSILKKALPESLPVRIDGGGYIEIYIASENITTRDIDTIDGVSVSGKAVKPTSMSQLFCNLLRPLLAAHIERGRFYAGIGSRETPLAVLNVMVRIGHFLAEEGMILRSGGAKGADTAFENGCDSASGEKEIFLPEARFNGSTSSLYPPSHNAIKMASDLVGGRWMKLNLFAKMAHARNCHQILGRNLDDPVKFVVFWSVMKRSGRPSGGTATAVELARSMDIPCFHYTADGWGKLVGLQRQ